MHPLFVNVYPGVAVTENTEYVIQTSQFPAPWNDQAGEIVEEFDAKSKSGITFWKFEENEEATASGHHMGRMLKEYSFTLELPGYTLDYFDAGRLGSHGYLVGLAKKDGHNYVYVVDFNKLKDLKTREVNEFAVVDLSTALEANAMAMIQLPAAAKSVKVDPTGKYFITAGDEAFVFDFAKVKMLLLIRHLLQIWPKAEFQLWILMCKTRFNQTWKQCY